MGSAPEQLGPFCKPVKGPVGGGHWKGPGRSHHILWAPDVARRQIGKQAGRGDWVGILFGPLSHLSYGVRAVLTY